MTSHAAVRHIEVAASHRSAAFLYALAHNLGAAAKRLDSWLEVRRRATTTRRALSEMTDRELRDIGLTRFDIEDVATGNWPRAPH